MERVIPEVPGRMHMAPAPRPDVGRIPAMVLSAEERALLGGSVRAGVAAVLPKVDEDTPTVRAEEEQA